MIAWDHAELKRIAQADDLHIAPLRDDGKTYGTPTWIWSVAVDGELYVRAYNGRNSRWHKAALRQKAGSITAAGMTRRLPSRRSRGRSTTASTRPIARSTATALISRR